MSIHQKGNNNCGRLIDVRKRRLNCLFLTLLIVTLMFPASTQASVYQSYKKQVNILEKQIRKEISLGGSSLIKGVSITKKDTAEWKEIEKLIRGGKNKNYVWQCLDRPFSSEAKALGYVDTLVGVKYRYLELACDAKKNKDGKYVPIIDLGRKNPEKLSYYITHKKAMIKKLNSLYNREIFPYRKKSISMKLAIAVSVVDYYLSYDLSAANSDDPGIETGNLAYSINSRKGVCSDYSYLLDYFLKKLGMTARIVGIFEKFFINGELGYHAVNAVKIDGGWFYIDATNMDMGKYAKIQSEDNIWFNASLDWLTFPGWKARSVY